MDMYPLNISAMVPQLQEIKAKVIAVADGEILDYPSRKDRSGYRPGFSEGQV